MQQTGLSQVQACAIVGQARRSLFYRRRPTCEFDIQLTECIERHAQERIRFGWRRLLVLVRREKNGVGEYKLRRIYRALGLQVRPRKKRKVRYIRGNAISVVARPNERWSIDFMHDRLGTGRNYRTMNIVDDFTSECLALEPNFSFGSHDVIRCFEQLAFERGELPMTIRFDNGPEFTSRAMLQWGAQKSIDLHFIEPGKPTQNAKIESLNGKIRDELLNAHTFRTIEHVREVAEAWRKDYNEVRPHSSLGNLTPQEFARKH